MTSRNHVRKGLYDMGVIPSYVIKGHAVGSSLPKVTTLPSLTVIGLVEWRYNVANLSGYIS